MQEKDEKKEKKQKDEIKGKMEKCIQTSADFYLLLPDFILLSHYTNMDRVIKIPLIFLSVLLGERNCLMSEKLSHIFLKNSKISKISSVLVES